MADRTSNVQRPTSNFQPEAAGHAGPPQPSVESTGGGSPIHEDAGWRVADSILTLAALSIPLAVASAREFYYVAAHEPFYGSTPDDLRKWMAWPIAYAGLWLIWSLALVFIVVMRKAPARYAVLLLWPVLWMWLLSDAIGQYVRDIGVLESPSKPAVIRTGQAPR